jgi:hypothetical protein
MGANMIEPKDSSLVRTALTGMIKVVATLQQSGQTEISGPHRLAAIQ